MIYLDSSVVLSRLFAEAQSPLDAFWSNNFTSSRLLEYEVLNRVHARAPGSALVVDARDLLDQCNLLNLSVGILARALAPFPAPVRTTMDCISQPWISCACVGKRPNWPVTTSA